MPGWMERLTQRISGRQALPANVDPTLGSMPGGQAVQMASVTARVDDSAGWGMLTGRAHDYDIARVQEIYADALEAWRKNPLAWRAIAITTNYVVGDQVLISSSNRALDRFIKSFWSHPKNNMPARLESMCDELSRSGDLFVLLFRNPQDGMSYIRFVTKDRIQRIETAPNDWETEIAFYEAPTGWNPDWGEMIINPAKNPAIHDFSNAIMHSTPAFEPRRWLSTAHPDAANEPAVMLHYAVNRPCGALLGESDLTTMLPWLLRYSRMLEDRVRLNWAMRSFLWLVTVPAARVREKQEQYRNPPEAGSIIIKDESENWQANAPNLRGLDAARDLQAIRSMIDAGSGYPPHWRGDAGDISLATAQAMQAPTERQLRRRQQYFCWMLMDILYHAYQRAVEIGRARRLAETAPSPLSYAELFQVNSADISRWDNESLARAARDAAAAFQSLGEQLGSQPESLRRLALETTFKFAGEPLSKEEIEKVISELREIKP